MQFSDQPTAKGANGKRATAEAPAAKKRKGASWKKPKPVSLDSDSADSDLTDEDSETSDAESPVAPKPKKVRWAALIDIEVLQCGFCMRGMSSCALCDTGSTYACR